MACSSKHSALQLAVFLALSAALVGGAGSAWAIEHAYVEHLIVQGDTLERLSTQFYGNPKLWTHLQKTNNVANPRALRPGSVLRIPVKYMPAQDAEISFVQGTATVGSASGDTAAAPLKAGQKVTEGQKIQVEPDSFVTIKLADGTLIRVQANSEVQLKQLRRKGRSGSLQSVLEMQRGSVSSTVGDGPDPQRRFDVRTPRSTTSVRGTSFDVSLTPDGKTISAVTQGNVAVRGMDARANTDDIDARGTRLDAGQGISVNEDGRVGAQQNMLPSPDLSVIPATLEDANFLSFELPPVANAVAYQVQVARDPTMSEVLRAGTFRSAQVRMRIVDDGEYYVLARAVDSDALPGMPAQRKVHVKTQPPPPLYQQPTPGGTTSRTSGELKCTRVSGVQSYRIQVTTAKEGAAPDFSAPLLNVVHQGDCIAVLKTLQPGSYQWRAASIRTLQDGTLDQGPFAPAQAFTLAESPQSLDIAAMDVREDIPGINLRWPGETGQTYRLQVAATEDFAEILTDEPSDQPQWSSRKFKPGEYYVRIQTHDVATGLDSPFSTARQVRSAAEVQTGFGLPVQSTDGEPLTLH